MKNFLIGLLIFLVVCSTSLNVFMFTELKKNSSDDTQTQPEANVITSFRDINNSNRSFNTDLIGDWTDGRDAEFHVMNDGSAYFVSTTEWEDSEGRFIYSLNYGYIDGNNFVEKKRYHFENVSNGGDGIYRYSDEEVITECLRDAKVSTYRIILEGNTITGFGNTTYQFIREQS